jgi:hypothetical protein
MMYVLGFEMRWLGRDVGWKVAGWEVTAPKSPLKPPAHLKRQAVHKRRQQPAGQRAGGVHPQALQVRGQARVVLLDQVAEELIR